MYYEKKSIEQNNMAGSSNPVRSDGAVNRLQGILSELNRSETPVLYISPELFM